MVESRLWSNSSSSSSRNPREEEEEEESDISNVLPLQLTRSYPIPPAPNRSRASIDWLQDFGGFSWIAYGASSLLIISHFPSPLSPQQTSVGPVFRQVIEPPCGGAGPALVKAVAWSPSHPSNGDIAVASENRICLYSAERGNMAASFHWRQISGLVQYSAVEAIKWTGSGDGLIAAGIEVVLWKKKNKVWEVVWKTTAELPQSLVSATWSIEGPSATAAHAFHDSNLLHDQPSFLSREASRCVLIYHNDGKSGFVKHELCHPQSVTMVQWRPPTATSLTNNSSYSRRDVLLTCCLDGTVRLWCEIDSGRARKSVKDAIDQKATRRSFHVAAVIETQQSLKGNLGIDTFVTWPVEVKDMSGRSEGLDQCCSTEVSDYDMVGRCEWLIGVGPEFSCTFWAIHCLDDTSPLRFPRITLWKKQDLRGFQAGHLCNTGNTDSKSQPILVQAVILRSQPFGPPTICSLLQLMPDNSIYWSNLHDSTLSNAEDGSSNKPSKENSLSCCSSGFLNQGGHTGKILQVAVHPFNCEVELAVSLDSNGSLLFWSLPTMNCILGQPTLALPTWKLLGRIDTREFSTNVEYSVLRWAPSVFNEKHLLFMGHTGGVDCFVIIISESEGEKIICHKICTIPFPSHSHGHGPDHICTISLPSTCSQSLVSNSFLLLTIWMEGFLVLSWKVVLHFDDICGSNCGSSFNARNDATSEAQRYKYTFDGRRCCVVVEPCSSKFPDPGNHDQVTSVATVSPDNWVPSVQKKWPSSSVMCSYTSVYQMATGCSDGSVKLWRIHQEELTSHSELISLPWELVGVFTAHQGPISAISLSGCGSKIATIGNEGQGSANALHIWESVYLTGVGNFSLEDSIPLDGSVTAMQWLSVGNGQLLLGVCLKNELRVYAKKRCNGPIQVKLGKAVETYLWSCIALGHTLIASQDFLWGPRSIPILVHDAYFRLFGLWSYKDSKNLSHSYQKPTIDCPDHFIGEMDEDIFCAVYNDSNMFNLKESATDEKGEGCKSLPSVNIKIKNGHGFCNFCLKISQQQDFCTNSRPYSMLETLEKFCGSLPIYHPETLFLCLCSGNWKRAYVAVRHLVEYLNSVDTSDKGVKDNNLKKFCSAVPQIQLSQYFGEFYLKSVRHEGQQWGGEISSKISGSQFCRDLFQHEDVNSVLYASGNVLGVTSGNSEISGFIKALEKPCDVKALTSMERTQILAMVDLLGEVSDSCHSSAYESFDEPGRRYWVAVRFQQLYFLRKFGKLAAEELVVDSGLIAWAFHSDCHDNLFSSLVPNEPSWLQMRRLGVGYWFTNAAGLRMKMEKLARSQYLKKKDPKDCALLYLALNRLQVLTGLFKVSKDEKDRPLVGFLSRNFQEEKNKAAALKNAYVLMGKHQLELAIAFFLLGGDPSSAVTVCAKNLGDEQLALVICRLIEGYGGPLERHIISTFLLPSAIEKKDYWLASVFEWVLGNYSQSFRKLVSFRRACTIDKVVIPCNHALSSDPSIGQYCALLSSKSTMKNSVGEYTAGVLSRWAAWVTASALNQCGLPLEALECLSTSLGTPEGKDQLSLSDIGKLRTANEIFQHDAMNWLLGDVAYYLESFAKMNLAMQYISKLLMEHPNWPDTHLADSSSPVCDKANQFELLLEKFEDKLNAGVALFEQRYSLEPARLLNMILIFSCNNGLLFHGYCILHGYTSQEHLCRQHHNDDNFILYPGLLKMLLNAGEEVSVLLARFIVGSSIPCSTLKSSTLAGNAFCEDSLGCFRHWDFCLREVTYTIGSFRFLLKLYGSKFLTEDFTVKTFIVLDLLEYCTYFASAWSERNSKVLFLLIRPILTASAPSGIKTVDLKKILYQTMDIMLNDTSNDHEGNVPATDSGQWQHGQIDPNMLAVPEDERWQLIGACLWKQLSNLSSDLLNTSITDSGDDYSSSLPLCGDASLPSNSTRCQSDMIEPIKLFPLLLAKLLKTTLAYISSSLAKQLVSFLRLKVENGLPVPTLVLLEESRHAQPRTSHNFLKQESDAMKFNNQNAMSFFEMLWEISFDPGKVCESIVLEKNNIFDSIGQNLSRSWTYMHKGIMADDENIHTIDHGVNRGSFTTEASSAARNQHSDSSIFHVSGRRDSGLIKSFTCFQNPKEIFKKNGELLEALCVNSLDRRQAALASNRKGLIFFDSKVEEPFRERADYIWAEADWPRNGWAGSQSTPIPTFVSPGIGLGSKKGAHLGLGGATIGRGSLARPGKDLTGGGAFGIPGYAGVGASGFGWGEQEDFEEFVDPPATVENISTRTLSSHPSRPFFLVGSSNTHIYLWEFGRDRASATYGVLPAANVPPPYALASISALQFDCCGHRFASAALDGTVCTWQLEVGGRSNVYPTESSLCFNGHASDLAYVSASGSILAVAGYSPNGINLVIWDTLAPPVTSQASIICHEGGARSLSVFDNDLGSGSISPLIVTGGKGGDVGLHDFRYIATGRSKRNRHSTEQSMKSPMHDMYSAASSKFVEQNRNGMLWHIPRAHQGSVTRISTIPNTSLFLTGSKDGDVKLWDARGSEVELVFHWQKMHERHTFLQPNSRSFGGVVRAAVTDIQVLPHGFLTCGGDGSVKMVQLKDIQHRI